MALSRLKLRLVVGLLTGHYLNRHFCTMRLVPDPTCPLCGEEEETAKHFLCECVALGRLRMELFGVDVIAVEDIRGLDINQVWRLMKKSSRFDV